MKSRFFTTTALLCCFLSPSCKDDELQKEKITELEEQVNALSSEKEFLSTEIQRVTPKPGSLGAQEVAVLDTRIKELQEQIAKHATVVSELERLKQEHALLVAKVTKAQPALLGLSSERATAFYDDDGKPRQRYTNAMVTIEGNIVSGIGFVAAIEGKKFLYMPAHVLSGNAKLTIRSKAGTVLTKFGNLEVAEAADLIRLEVLDEIADFIEIIPVGTELAKEADLVALGTLNGGTEIEAVKGRSASSAGDVLEVDYGLLQSDSGAALVDPFSGRAVGIVTNQVVERSDIWNQTEEGAAVAPRVACRLNKAWQWKSVKIGVFLAEASALKTYDDVTRLAEAMATVRISDTGLDLEQSVGGNSNAAAVFAMYKGHNLVVSLMKFKTEMGEKRLASGGADTKKKLRSLLSAMQSEASRGKESFKPATFTWYHRSQAKVSVEARDQAVDSLNDSLEDLK